MSDKKVKCPKCGAPEEADNPPPSPGENPAWVTVNIYSLAVYDVANGARIERQCMLCRHEWREELPAE